MTANEQARQGMPDSHAPLEEDELSVDLRCTAGAPCAVAAALAASPWCTAAEGVALLAAGAACALALPGCECASC